MNVYELDRFINAFEDPYPYARTMIHGKTVILKKLITLAQMLQNINLRMA